MPRPAMSILVQQKSYDGFFKVILAKKSAGTREQYQGALKDFERYCIKEYSKSLEEMLLEIKGSETDDRLALLQRWVDDSESMPRSKMQKAGFVNRYLYYRGIDIDSRDWKQMEFGKFSKSYKKPLSRDILKQIFNRSSYKRKILYLFLISTGCRINEAVKIRKKDFDLNQERVKVEIFQSKNDATRIGFLTKECANMIKPVLMKLEPNDLVFDRVFDNVCINCKKTFPKTSKECTTCKTLLTLKLNDADPERCCDTEAQCFRRVTDQLGFGTERRKSRVRHFTIHSLRSFTFTQFTKVHNGDLAHAYIGHEQYLDQYLSLPEEEQLELFIKVEPELYINEARPETDAVIDLKKQLEEEKERFREEIKELRYELKNTVKAFLLYSGTKKPSIEELTDMVNDPKVLPFVDEEIDKIGHH